MVEITGQSHQILTTNKYAYTFKLSSNHGNDFMCQAHSHCTMQTYRIYAEQEVVDHQELKEADVYQFVIAEFLDGEWMTEEGSNCYVCQQRPPLSSTKISLSLTTRAGIHTRLYCDKGHKNGWTETTSPNVCPQSFVPSQITNSFCAKESILSTHTVLNKDSIVSDKQ